MSAAPHQPSCSTQSVEAHDLQPALSAPAAPGLSVSAAAPTGALALGLPLEAAWPAELRAREAQVVAERMRAAWAAARSDAEAAWSEVQRLGQLLEEERQIHRKEVTMLRAQLAGTLSNKGLARMHFAEALAACGATPTTADCSRVDRLRAARVPLDPSAVQQTSPPRRFAAPSPEAPAEGASRVSAGADRTSHAAPDSVCPAEAGRPHEKYAQRHHRDDLAAVARAIGAEFTSEGRAALARTSGEKTVPGSAHRGPGLAGQTPSAGTHLNVVDQMVRRRHAKYFLSAGERVSLALGLSPCPCHHPSHSSTLS